MDGSNVTYGDQLKDSGQAEAYIKYKTFTDSNGKEWRVKLIGTVRVNPAEFLARIARDYYL